MVKDLKGRPLEIAQELLRLDREDRNAVMDTVAREVIGYPRPLLLSEFRPALIWSTWDFDGPQARFFSDPIGHRDWSWTNMVVAGMLCYPCSFKREEIRLYARDAEKLSAIVRGCEKPMPWGGVLERIGQSNVHKLDRDVKVSHIPLPQPEHPVQREDVRFLLAEINDGRLPCAVWNVPRNIAATEAFMMEAEAPGAHELYRGVRLTAVFVGTLIAPPAPKVNP